jgi:alpha-D-ribose 1-methylphosphonate 5-triphosphate diphosphatase
VDKTFVIDNARIVLADAVVDGWLAVAGEMIVEVHQGRARNRDVDLAGDLLVPGLIELHTDHLETHLRPRPQVLWPALPAIVAYDAQISASGITTVFDSLRVGIDDGDSGGEPRTILEALTTARSLDLLRADHRLHLRCEICADGVVEQAEAILERHAAGLMSLMDHTPGTRQFVALEAWKAYYGGKSGLPEAELERLMHKKRALLARNYTRQRGALAALARSRAVVTASHDDATIAHVEEALAAGAAIAEFPTTMEAASAAHQAGIAVLMGAPNVVRGGSHSGNVAAEALARAGVLDILSSDYVPASLLMGAFALAQRIPSYGLAQAMRTVSLNPARAAGLGDRGRIAAGLRADLVRVHCSEGLPIVREVFRGGRRIL